MGFYRAMNERKNFLGLDWGAAKIGVALAHEEMRLALSYGVFKNDEHLLENIGATLEKEEIGTVVIGVPTRNAMRSESGGRQSAPRQGEHEGEKLGKRIAERFGVTVAYQDEMFTSKMAQQVLIAQGYAHVSTHDDAEAARILLQSFLHQKPLA